MIRLDKFLCDNNIGTRSQVKDLIKKGLVSVNDAVIKQPEFKVNEATDKVICQGVVINYQQFYYYMLNKPGGYVTAHQDNLNPTIMSLLKDAAGKDLSPVGRLDKDTEGLLLITNDGELNHKLLTPKSHVPKTYYVELRDAFTDEQAAKLEKGVDIGEKNPCMPAESAMVDFDKDAQDSHGGVSAILLTIHEGKFHQVKRMMQVVGNEVVYLKRVQFGSLKLDGALALGKYRPLTEQEIILLYEDVKK